VLYVGRTEERARGGAQEEEEKLGGRRHVQQWGEVGGERMQR